MIAEILKNTITKIMVDNSCRCIFLTFTVAQLHYHFFGKEVFSYLI